MDVATLGGGSMMERKAPVGKHLSPDWVAWIRLNVERGCDREEMLRILVDEGFGRDQVVEHLDHDAPPGRVLRIPGAQRLRTSLAELHVLDDFLAEAECEALTAQIRSRLRASEIADVGDVDRAFRTSSTCDLGVLDNSLIRDVDRRICATIGIDGSHAEVIQGQYYEVGQQFKAHTDFFEADQLQTYDAGAGQRTYTFFVYLNDVDHGGETEFMRLGVKFRPKRGRALVWNNLTPSGSPNHNTIHQAHPVLDGHKSVITKWFRTGGFR